MAALVLAGESNLGDLIAQLELIKEKTAELRQLSTEGGPWDIPDLHSEICELYDLVVGDVDAEPQEELRSRSEEPLPSFATVAEWDRHLRKCKKIE